MALRAGCLALMLSAALGCGRARQQVERTGSPPEVAVEDSARESVRIKHPQLPPRAAYLAGLLPLRTIGVDEFLQRYPGYDGRGVLIGILDTGVDPGLPGLQQTSTGSPKLLDVRDFSGEGRVKLDPVQPREGRVELRDGITLGVERFAGFATPPYYAGFFSEARLGLPPGADVNGDGDVDDAFPVLVGRASDGWVAVTDTDGDGSIADERPVRDFHVAGEYFAYRASGYPSETGPLNIAVNIEDEAGVPRLDFVFDNRGHGSHVAGIAAGHRLFGVEGFDGVAPGAQVLALKISDNSRGAISVTGAMVRAMNYAADYAHARGLPLILNMSFGIGARVEGTAAIDSIVNDFALKHPDVLFVVSTGNDGPGLSTLSTPATADFSLAVCAIYPGVFLQVSQPDFRAAPDLLGWFSSRGGEFAKPDVCAPGIAFSNVPLWQTGEEISAGTSMASPQVAGAAALLLSGMAQEQRMVRAVDLAAALRASAAPILGETVLDQGTGIPNLTRAFLWLRVGHQVGRYLVRAGPMGGNAGGGSASYRRNGLEGPGDTLQSFTIASIEGQPAARLRLESDRSWLKAPEVVEFSGAPATVTVRFDEEQLREPGVYVGTVWARPTRDTLAGALFGLTNTVIVPHRASAGLRASVQALPGALQRFFVDVPDGAAGLSIKARIEPGSGPASVFLFEPSGQPYRGGHKMDLGGESPRVAVLNVPVEDLVEGVYEIDVAASEIRRAAARIEVGVPPLRIESGPEGRVVVVNGSSARQSAIVSARALGVARRMDVGGSARGAMVQLRVPDFAAITQVDISVVPEVWGRLTDFGVTVATPGRVLEAASLDYPFGRIEFAIPEEHRESPLYLELVPGFAHIEPLEPWAAAVEVRHLYERPLPLGIQDASPVVDISLAAGQSVAIDFAEFPEVVSAAEGQLVVVEVVAEVRDGPATVRRLMWDRRPEVN